MGPWGPVPHTLGRGLVSWPSLNPQCPGCRHSHGGGFNRPCHLLGRGGPWARSRGRQGAVLLAHTAPLWPLHTPGVTVDLDDLPGLVGSLVVHTRAVLLGHAASAPIGQQPHRADTARHAVSAELWTGGCRQQSLWPGSGMPPTRAPPAAQPRPSGRLTQSTSRVWQLRTHSAPGASAEALLQSRNTIGATHPAETATLGGPPGQLQPSPRSWGEHGAPRAEVQGRPHLCSAPWPPDSSASHSHTSYERRGWGQSGPLPHCPHPDPRRDPGLVVSQGRAPSAGLR